jgi:hypothetical protein
MLGIIHRVIQSRGEVLRTQKVGLDGPVIQIPISNPKYPVDISPGKLARESF